MEAYKIRFREKDITVTFKDYMTLSDVIATTRLAEALFKACGARSCIRNVLIDACILVNASDLNIIGYDWDAIAELIYRTPIVDAPKTTLSDCVRHMVNDVKFCPWSIADELDTVLQKQQVSASEQICRSLLPFFDFIGKNVINEEFFRGLQANLEQQKNFEAQAGNNDGEESASDNS